MRGVETTYSRLPCARAFFAGVVILVGAFAPAAGAQATGTDETAMAVPRLAPPDGNAGVALPQPLDPSDVGLVRRALDLQAHGDMAAADLAIGRLQSDLLLGPLLAQRYLGRFHHSTPAELTAWLERFANQPNAEAIRALLRRRLPRGASLPPLPTAAAPPPAQLPSPPPPPVAEDAPPLPQQPALESAVAARMARGNEFAALHLIDSRRNLSPAYASLLRGEVARDLFTHNDDAQAVRVGRQDLRELRRNIRSAWRLTSAASPPGASATRQRRGSFSSVPPRPSSPRHRRRQPPPSGAPARPSGSMIWLTPLVGCIAPPASAPRSTGYSPDVCSACPPASCRVVRSCRRLTWTPSRRPLPVGAPSPCCRWASRNWPQRSCAACGPACAATRRCATPCCWLPPAWG